MRALDPSTFASAGIASTRRTKICCAHRRSCQSRDSDGRGWPRSDHISCNALFWEAALYDRWCSICILWREWRHPHLALLHLFHATRHRQDQPQFQRHHFIHLPRKWCFCCLRRTSCNAWLHLLSAMQLFILGQYSWSRENHRRPCAQF